MHLLLALAAAFSFFGNHSTCTEETRTEIQSASSCQVVLPSKRNATIDLPAADPSVFYAGQAPFEGFLPLSQDSYSHVKFNEGTMEMRVLFEVEQTLRHVLWCLRIALGPMHRRALCPWAVQEEGDRRGLVVYQLVGTASGVVPRTAGTKTLEKEINIPQRFHPEGQSRQGQPSAESTATERQRRERCTVLPAHRRPASIMAWPWDTVSWRHLRDKCESCSTSSLAAPHNTTSGLTRSSAGRSSAGGCGKGPIPGSEQGSRQHPSCCRTCRGYEHKPDCCSLASLHKSGSADLGKAQGVEGVADQTQRSLARAPQGGDCQLGRSSSIIHLPADCVQGPDGKSTYRASSCQERDSTVEPPGCGHRSCSTLHSGPHRTGGDRDRRNRQCVPDGECAEGPQQLCPDLPCGRQKGAKGCECAIGRHRYGPTGRQETKIGRCRRIWWSWWFAAFVSLGDGTLGPHVINHRAPTSMASWVTFGADAYADLIGQGKCAASPAVPWWSSSSGLSSLHSIRAEHDFKDTFQALQCAIELRSQIIDDLFDCPPLHLSPSSCFDTRPIRKWLPQFRCPDDLSRTLFECSTLGRRTGTARSCSRVRFCEQVQVHLWGPYP